MPKCNFENISKQVILTLARFIRTLTGRSVYVNIELNAIYVLLENIFRVSILHCHRFSSSSTPKIDIQIGWSGFLQAANVWTKWKNWELNIIFYYSIRLQQWNEKIFLYFLLTKLTNKFAPIISGWKWKQMISAKNLFIVVALIFNWSLTSRKLEIKSFFFISRCLKFQRISFNATSWTNHSNGII